MTDRMSATVTQMPECEHHIPLDSPCHHEHCRHNQKHPETTRSNTMSTAQQITTAAPAIGQLWPGQGGIYAGIMPGEDGRQYHVIRAVDDISDGIAWGEYAQRLEGCDNKWDGLENTKAMAAAGNEAAIKALALEIEGHRDFFIPAQKQYQFCYATIQRAFAEEWYWTSTQCSSYNGWCQCFDGGDSYVNGKGSTLRVCAVRRFLAD